MSEEEKEEIGCCHDIDVFSHPDTIEHEIEMPSTEMATTTWSDSSREETDHEKFRALVDLLIEFEPQYKHLKGYTSLRMKLEDEMYAEAQLLSIGR